MINLRENLIQIYFMVRLFLFRSSSCIIGSLVTFFSSSAIKTLQQQQQNNFNWKIFWQNLMKKLPPPKKLISSFSFKTGWSRRRNMFKNKMFNFLSKASKLKFVELQNENILSGLFRITISSTVVSTFAPQCQSTRFWILSPHFPWDKLQLD